MANVLTRRQQSSSSTSGLTITIINGQPMLTLEDTTRANKVLSVSENNLTFSENQLTHNDWIRIGTANHTESGYVAQFDGTLVFASAHCENTSTFSKDIHFYINNTDMGSIGTLSGGNNTTFINTILNIDFNQGDILRLRAKNGIAGIIQDSVIELTTKWRGI